MAHALRTFLCRGAFGTRVNPDTIGCVWTGEFDFNTLRVDGEICESGKKKLWIQKYPDTCGRGLRADGARDFKISDRFITHKITFGSANYSACVVYTTTRESRVGAVVRALASHQCCPGSNPGPGVICGLSLLLVLILALRVFVRVIRFSSLHKNQHF